MKNKYFNSSLAKKKKYSDSQDDMREFSLSMSSGDDDDEDFDDKEDDIDLENEDDIDEDAAKIGKVQHFIL